MTKMLVYFAAAALVAIASAEPILISVYYESLCPDSIRFINRQLYPTWTALGEDYVKVDFVPYGKATHEQDANGQWTYQCQHGPDECAGNRVQACALDVFAGNQTLDVEFVHCAMSNEYPPTAGPTCAEQVAVSYTPIQACIDGDRGDTLLVAFGDRTHNFEPTITFVPTIAFDGVYTSADQASALADLLSLVCEKIVGEKPAPCAGRQRIYY